MGSGPVGSWSALGVLLAGALAAKAAEADPPGGDALRLPIAEAERPLTLPRLVASGELEGDATREGTAGTYANLDAWVYLGVTDDLEIRALPLPLQLAGPAGDGLHYGETSEYKGPSLGVLFRFVRSAVEIGAAVDVRVVTAEGLTGVVFIPSLPMRIHLGKRVRLDAVPAMNVRLASESARTVPTPAPATSDNAVRLDLPLSVLWNVVDVAFVGLMTGVTVNDVSNAASTTGVPLGALFGFTVPGRLGPLLDVGPFFNFPYLFLPGVHQVVNAGEYQVGVSAFGYLYL